MHETHYFYLEQAESGAELQSIFCLSFSAPLIAHPLLILRPPTRPLSFYPQSTLSSIPFGSVLNWSVAGLGPVFRSFVRSFAHSFRMAGWRYPVQPEFASRIPLFAFQFHETLATAPLPPPPLPNGGYKHKYEFKGPQMTVSRITSPTIPCILIRSGYPPRRSPTIS